MHRAFISYSRDDSAIVLRLAEDLKAAGVNVWCDLFGIVPGQRWSHTVEDALTDCQSLLVILSPSSVSSSNVADEVAYAREEHKVIIPVLYRDCKIPFQLRTLQYADLRTDYNRGLKTLFKTLGVERLDEGPVSTRGRGKIPYSPAKSDFFTPFQRGQYFINNEAPEPSSLCAELSRLAYCQKTVNKSFDVDQIRSVLQGIGFADRAFIESPNAALYGGTHCFITAGPTGNPASQVAVVAFRGTDADDPTDIGNNADAILKPWEQGGRVHTGFANALDSVRAPLDEALRSINLSVLFTGHNLGAALATLAASRYKATLSNVSLYTYGSPLVGDPGFVATLNNVLSFRYRDCCDLVTRVPPEEWGYRHVGPPHYIDRNGIISIDPSMLSIAEDRIAAEIEYTTKYASKMRNLGVRELADHSPINYVWAVSAAKTTM
jgi:hypothetical protein